MSVKVTNNAFGTLAANIAAVQTVITLAPGQGGRFPLLLPADWYWGTLLNAANVIEIVKVTGMTGDTATVIRAQDGTVAVPYNAGDRFELRPTAALFNDKLGAAEAAATYLTAAQATAGYYPLAGGVLNGSITVNTGNPLIVLKDTNQVGGHGDFRMVSISQQFWLQRNTAAARDYSTSTFPIIVAANDVISLSQRPNWGGLTPWDTGNLNPAAYLPLSGGTVAGPVVFNAQVNFGGVVMSGNGRYYFHPDGSKFLQWDGTNYNFLSPSGSLFVNSQIVYTQANLQHISQLSNDAGYMTSLSVAPNRITGGNSVGFGVNDVSLELVDAHTVRLVISYLPNPNPPGGGGGGGA